MLVSSAFAETSHNYEDLTGPILVRSPTDLAVGKTYPAIFYFHGTSGQATTASMRPYVEGLDCFVVGMSYRKAGFLRLDEGVVEGEIESFRRIRDDLLKRYPIDPKKCYVAGFSKGGWISAFLVEAEKSVAGAMVLGAGALAKMPFLDDSAARGKAVYIGIGVLEENHINSVRLEERMAGLNALTYLDEWDETGHTMPQGGAKGLRQWLQLQLQPEDLSTDDLKGRASERLEEIKDLEAPGERFLALLRFEHRPFIRKLGNGAAGVIRRERETLVRTEPEAAREAEAWRTYQLINARELKSRKVTDLKRYLSDHQAAAKRFSGTICEDYCANAAKRLESVLAGSRR